MYTYIHKNRLGINPSKTDSYLRLILLILVSTISLVHEYRICHHHQEANNITHTDDEWPGLEYAVIVRRVTGRAMRCGHTTLCITVFVVFGAVVRGGNYNIGCASNRMFGVVEVGTSPGPPANTKHGSVVLFVNTLVLIAEIVVRLWWGSSKTIVC